MLLEADVGAHVAIDTNRFDKLLTLTRTAIDYDGMLDKGVYLIMKYLMLSDYH
jgi:hypothetical protein